MMLPRMERHKIAIFSSKQITVFHETFAVVGKKAAGGKSVGVVWHKAIQGRREEDLTICLPECCRLSTDAL